LCTYFSNKTILIYINTLDLGNCIGANSGGLAEGEATTLTPHQKYEKNINFYIKIFNPLKSQTLFVPMGIFYII